jgi:formylglycine-generating enzyme required for sulfatase activity
MKNGMLFFSMMFVFFFSIVGVKQEKVLKQNNNGLREEKAKAPTNIKEIEKKADKVYFNNKGFLEAEFKYGIVMVYIPEGKFIMGTTKGEKKELPLHSVYLSGYWIGKYPVTVAQFRIFAEETNYITDSEKGEGSWIEEGGKIRYDVSWDKPNFKQDDNHPVICVSWNDANAYSKWLSRKIGIDFCLPTEAQWEKAARGTDQRTYPWGNQIPDGTFANFADLNYQKRFGSEGRNSDVSVNDGYVQTSPVNAYPKGQSPYGVFDMAGNTIDWLYDWYDPEYYSKSPLNNPIGPIKKIKRKKYKIPGGWASNLQRCIRGGAWTDASGELSLTEGVHSIRSDMRERTDQFSSDDHLGFRVAVSYY